MFRKTTQMKAVFQEIRLTLLITTLHEDLAIFIGRNIAETNLTTVDD